MIQRLASVALGSLLVLAATPLRALEVRVLPESPQLGDTLEILVEPDAENPGPPERVTFRGQEYPTYPIGGDRYRALIPTTPLDDPGRVDLKVFGSGPEVRNLLVWLRDRSFPTQRIWLSGSANRPATDVELQSVAELKALVTPEKYWQGPFLAPSQGRVSTIFGVRRYYNGDFAENYYHRGVDYAAGTGAPVVAPAAGRVALIGREAEGFHVHGNTVGIDHGQGVISIFLHLNAIDVQPGTTVNAGQRIGTIGSTGASTGPHLHWGLYLHGQAVDPVPWRNGRIQ